jgi:hypothetical protein
MKNTICISLVLLVLIGCKKPEDTIFVPGKINATVNYLGNSGKSSVKSNNLKAADLENLYTGFGDYIMSITPNKVSAKFYCIRYAEDLSGHNMMEIINNNLPPYDPLRYADFTNNSSVSMVPSLGGDLINEGASFAQSVEFKYLTFDIKNIYLEIQLPQEYISIDVLDQFNYPDNLPDDEWELYCTLTNNILNARHRLFLLPIFGNPQSSPSTIVFGGTDSTYLLNVVSDVHNIPYNTPYHGNRIIRSKNFNTITFDPSVSANKTTLITATLSFDYNNLIQIYAGTDNIPYTKDDIFLYEPNFFDRLTVNVTIE